MSTKSYYLIFLSFEMSFLCFEKIIMYVGYDNSVSSLHLRYNLGHNILELYNDLVQIRLSTSKTKRDILQTCKLGI